MSTAIITGASSGLGIEFLKTIIMSYPEIDQIWIIARRADRLQELVQAYPNKTIIPLVLDLTLQSDIEKYIEKLNVIKPDVKLLINNAGSGKLGKVWELDPIAQANSVGLNCSAVTAFSSATINYMSEGSAIINTCSIASFVPTPNMTVYAATKSFVLAFSKGLRVELKPKKINCLAVCPSPMDTEFIEKGGIKGKSKAFETLPYCNPKTVAEKSVKKALNGTGIYTPRVLYKIYRVLGKLLPHGLLMKFTKI
ncbi:SDR family NAD(P)-dependent oxidoreductase [Eubacteriales bacterium OttesenSCG-928-G02]|nr:SDR family NAD(P)-dependent oxidoreductase [Eubacteriales bacterium OttesenSCG-928-G02]